MEGIDRYEISSRLGIDADTKPGNRLVSTSIHSTVRNREKYFGEFQKTEGRFRVKKLFNFYKLFIFLILDIFLNVPKMRREVNYMLNIANVSRN